MSERKEEDKMASKGKMEVLEVNGKFYAVLLDENGKRISTDGPYPERYQAESMSRIREIG